MMNAGGVAVETARSMLACKPAPGSRMLNVCSLLLSRSHAPPQHLNKNRTRCTVPSLCRRPCFGWLSSPGGRPHGCCYINMQDVAGIVMCDAAAAPQQAPVLLRLVLNDSGTYAAAAGDGGVPTRLPPSTLAPKRPLPPLGSGGPQMLGARLGMPMGRLCVFPCSE